MPNRIELQNKGKGRSKNPTTGFSQGPGTSHAGISRSIRATKREEAEERNRKTPLHRRRSAARELGGTRFSTVPTLILS